MEKLEPGTKVKVLGCSNNHKYKIGSIITIKKCYSSSLDYGFMYDIIGGCDTIGSNDIEVVEDTFKVGSKCQVVSDNSFHYVTIGDIVTIKYCKDSKWSSGDKNEIGYRVKESYTTIRHSDLKLIEPTFKVGDVIKFKTGNTRYVIVEVLDNVYKYKHLSNGKIFGCSKNSAIEVLDKTSEDYEYIFKNCKYILDTIEWKERYNNFIGNNISSTFKVGDMVKVIDAGRMASTYDEAAKAIGLTKWVRSNGVYSSEQIKSITNSNYYKVIGFHYRNKYEYAGIENLLDGKQYIINSEGLEHINLSGSVLTGISNLQDELYTHTAIAFAYALESTLAGTSTGCIDYPISYVDTSTVTVDKQGTIKNTLLINNNVMEKLNELRANKFFANEKNLTAIESLDTLLKDAIELISVTESELNKTKQKLYGLNKKLESATNNQDVAMLKDLITSTKVVQEFVDELKGKTISKFEQAKTKFDVAGYLKD